MPKSTCWKTSDFTFRMLYENDSVFRICFSVFLADEDQGKGRATKNISFMIHNINQNGKG